MSGEPRRLSHRTQDRQEHQTPEGEAQRDDEQFTHVAAWEWTGLGNEPVRHVEELEFENVALTQRSYK